MANSTNGYLVVPSITSPSYDITGSCVGSFLDSTVLWYEVFNSTYQAAKCKSTGFYPVVRPNANRICRLIASPIANCLIYELDQRCWCPDNKISVTIDTAGSLSYQCFATFNYVENCKTYRIVSGAYVCFTCFTGYEIASLNNNVVCSKIQENLNYLHNGKFN